MKTSGPAINYRETRGSLDWSHTRKLMADCDLFFSLELEEWPEAASSWVTRDRQWPKAQVGPLVSTMFSATLQNTLKCLGVPIHIKQPLAWQDVDS